MCIRDRHIERLYALRPTEGWLIVTFVHDQKIGIAKERSEILDTLPIIRIFLTIVKDRRRLPRLTSLHRPMGRGFDTEDRMAVSYTHLDVYKRQDT